MLIEIRRWDNDNVIFSYDYPNNSIKITVEEAIRQGVSLAYAYLAHTDLSDIDLTDADLTDADLTDADLTDAILYKADLKYSILTSTNFTDATLVGVIFYYASCNNTNFNKADLTDAIFTYTTFVEPILLDTKYNSPILSIIWDHKISAGENVYLDTGDGVLCFIKYFEDGQVKEERKYIPYGENS